MKILRGNVHNAADPRVPEISLSQLCCISILGGSENGQWLVEKEATAAQAELKMEDTSEDSKGISC